MKIEQLVTEANIAARMKDPKMIKMLDIAMRHDGTLPKAAIARLGPKVNPEQVLHLWSQILDTSLASTDYGNISADGKFDEWLTRLYINGQVDYEDINGEGGDALGAWKALSIRGWLLPQHQNFNQFSSLRQVQAAVLQNRHYRDHLQRIKNQEEIEKHKKERKEIVIVDDDRFLVTVPMNYGACYTFNNAHGFNASFCTGSSSGQRWFNNYAPDGPIVSIFDKKNADDVNGKWQMHAPTNQLNNGNQSIRSDAKFAELFPGLMKKICAGLHHKAAEINQASQDVTRGGYDMDKAITDIKNRFPMSYNSGEEKEKPEQAADGPGTFVVTQTATGRTARIEAQNLEDARQQLLQRHPGLNLDDFTFQRQEA